MNTPVKYFPWLRILRQMAFLITFVTFLKTENSLRFGLVLRGKCINQKKLNVKTLPLVGTNWALQSYARLKLPSGRAGIATVGTFLPTLSF